MIVVHFMTTIDRAKQFMSRISDIHISIAPSVGDDVQVYRETGFAFTLRVAYRLWIYDLQRLEIWLDGGIRTPAEMNEILKDRGFPE